jgi:pyruvate dehydrogenase E2 component (dihydrolipoamide acetyltransferase)
MERLQKFPMPDVGEGLTEAEILEWKVGVGDELTVNQIMVEIETAKAAVELPSPHAGRVHALLVEPGITVDVGTPIIVIDTQPDAGPVPGDGPTTGSSTGTGSQEAPAPVVDTETGAKIGEVAADGRTATLVGYIPAAGSGARRPRKQSSPAPAPAPIFHAVAASFTGSSLPTAHPAAEPAADTGPVLAPTPAPRQEFSGVPLATPPVRKLAKDLGIDLNLVRPSRVDGVITRADLEAMAGVQNGDAAEGTAPAGAPPLAGYDPAGRERRVPIKGVRKMTAEAMVRSAFTAPHVTEFLTVDVTPMLELRDRLRRRPEFDGIKLTPLTFAARAVCLAVRRTPEVNATWDEAAGEIVHKQYVHLGIAAATPRGLVVPNVRDADSLDLRGLAAAITSLTDVARAGRTTPAQMTGGTFTITNVGVFGVDTGTPIINPGEAAILALGSIKDAPWVVDGQLTVRKVCQLALSFDHRVVDGQQGSVFLAEVGALLADPGLALTY